jgi:Type II restriction endonuclease EcoO109I
LGWWRRHASSLQAAPTPLLDGNLFIYGPLEFQREHVYYVVGIKSGTNWGNSDQINAMKNNFKQARQTLRQRGITDQIIAVNGCMYGTEANPLKEDSTTRDEDKTYYKYAGQAFWQFISRNDDLYQEIIVPIDQQAKQKDSAFRRAYTSKINEMTEEFTKSFMTLEKQINWVALVDFVSKRRD